MSADMQVLDALAALLTPAATGATTVDVERDDAAEPYPAAELPAINILAVDESIDTQQMLLGHAPMFQVRRLSLVVQIVYRGANSARSARDIGDAVETLVAANATLGGLCIEGMVPDGRQWVRDDTAEAPLTRQNTRFSAAYRTLNTAPATVIRAA